MDKKTCNRCGLEKTLTDFVKNSRCPDGRTRRCKACRCEKNAEDGVAMLSSRRLAYSADMDKARECNACGSLKKGRDFPFAKLISRGMTKTCKMCITKKSMVRYRGKYSERVKDKNKQMAGFLTNKYKGMCARVNLRANNKKAHLYKGLTVMPRDVFLGWAAKSRDFHEMFQAWEASDYENRLCPTVDRIDSKLGYTMDNVQWLTHSENSKKGTASRDGKPYCQPV